MHIVWCTYWLPGNVLWPAPKIESEYHYYIVRRIIACQHEVSKVPAFEPLARGRVKIESE